MKKCTTLARSFMNFSYLYSGFGGEHWVVDAAAGQPVTFKFTAS